MRLTKNFSRWEFTNSETAERLRIDNTIPYALMPNIQRVAEYLQTLRDRLCAHYQREIYITISSGYRCEELNKEVRGNRRSFHMKGLAADIRATSLSPYELAMFIRDHMSDIDIDQVILEHDKWVHVGLNEPELMRNEYLEAKWRQNIFGKWRVRFMPLVRRERKNL